MYASKTLIAVAAFLSTTNAAILNLYSDTGCKNAAGSVNVYENSCASTGGFQSYIITTGGGLGQVVTIFGPNDCAGSQTSCNSADSVNICYTAFDSAGGSNAVGSGAGCGVV